MYFFLGIKKPIYSYITAFVLNVSLGVFSALLIPVWMVDGAALAYVFGYASVFFLIVIFFSIKNQSSPFKAETYIDVPKNFEIDEKYIFESRPDSQEALIEASKEAGEFAKKFEDDMHNRLAISLAVEELGTNILEHGIKNKKRYIFEIRIVYDVESKRWILRTRDDCVQFNPVKYLEMHESKDLASNLGLRLVLNMAKNAEYYNTMGLNNLVVEF